MSNEHYERLKEMVADELVWGLNRDEKDAIRWALGELKRLEAENAALIENWPSDSIRTVYPRGVGKWERRGYPPTLHPTREAAVRAAAGLDASEPKGADQ